MVNFDVVFVNLYFVVVDAVLSDVLVVWELLLMVWSMLDIEPI